MAVVSRMIAHTRGHFLRQLIMMALPITVQSIMLSSRSLVDVLMLGQLGEAEIAAIGVAARAIFVTTIMLVGVTTGGALLTAQYWGANNQQGVRESTALTWVLSLLFALLTVALFVFFPQSIMALTTDSLQVQTLGSQYLMISSVSMCCVASIASMSVGLRAMHQPGISTFFSGIGIVSNIALNWLLIFGHWGLPAMGIQGAAIATVVSSVIEAGGVYAYLYGRRHALVFYWQDILAACHWFKIGRFLRLSLPTTLNFLGWAGGLFTYHAIMGHVGVQGLAALSVMTPIESLALSLLIGMSNAAAVLIGNQIGAQRYQIVYYQALGVTCLSFGIGVLLAILLFFLQSSILDVFSALTTETRALAEHFMWVLCAGVVLRSVPMTVIVGILRAGGDVKFCLGQDLCAQWLIGIPITAFAALVWGCAPETLYLLFLLEEMVKWGGSLYRLRSRRWIHNLIASE